MPDVRSLETRLAADKGYTGESPTKGGLPGFVCPRADSYGGRDGIIPPGIAAERGLVPRGMRRISPNDTARAANAARDSGASEVDQYREYYSRGAKESAPQVQPAKPAKQVQPAPPASPSPTPARPASKSGSAASFPAPVPVQPPGRAGRRSSSRKPGKVLSDPDDPGMFSRYPDSPGGDDTLDGFYEELGRPSAGTADVPPDAGKDGAAGDSGAVAPVEPAAPAAVPPPPPAHDGRSSDLYAALASMVAERDWLSAEVERMRARAWLAERKAEQAAETAAVQAPAGRPAETVRVVLGADETRLKVGGRGWECNIVGAVHAGRLGQSMVLTVSDTAYAAELLASVQLGDMVVVSPTGRTSCVYSGRCAKIYGDSGSGDFIAVLWLDVVPGE